MVGLPDSSSNEKTGNLDNEGRVITAEFKDYYIVCCYIPNAGQKLDRLDWKVNTFNTRLASHMASLSPPSASPRKGLIWCGDLNVAHFPIDLARPDTNKKSAGYAYGHLPNPRSLGLPWKSETAFH